MGLSCRQQGRWPRCPQARAPTEAAAVGGPRDMHGQHDHGRPDRPARTASVVSQRLSSRWLIPPEAVPCQVRNAQSASNAEEVVQFDCWIGEIYVHVLHTVERNRTVICTKWKQIHLLPVSLQDYLLLTFIFLRDDSYPWYNA